MILRTPPPHRKRKVIPETGRGNRSPASDRRLAIYVDAQPVAAHDPSSHSSGQTVCAYQCRQMMKSEVMDALGSAEKLVVDYQSKLESLTIDLAKSEEERNKFYDRLCYLEQELAASKGREKALQERLLKEVNDSHNRYHDQVKRNSELEIKLKEEADLRRKSESSSTAAQEKAASLEEKVAHLLAGFEKEKKCLVKDLSDSRSEAKLSGSRSSMEIEKMRIKADHAVQESELLRKESEDLRNRLNEELLQKGQLEVKLLDLMSKPHESGPKDQALVKHLQEELRNYEAEVLEARKLKNFHANVELLKEKLLEEQVRRERAEAELIRLQEMEISSIKQQGELEALRSAVKQIPDVSSSDELPLKFASLQGEAIENMRKVGEINEHLSELKVALEMANLSKQKTETECALAREKAEGSLLEVKELKQMLRLITEERDRLRNTVSCKQKGGDADGGETDNSDLKKLEMALSEKESSMKELENSLQEQREVINRQHAELILVNEKLNDEARRKKSLEREGDRLRAEISLLESKLGHGDYSSANTKVLRMVNTLAVDNDAKLTIEALRAELERTQAKLQAVEELKGQADAGNLIDTDISEKLAKLKGQIATLEKREERYKTVFADKISVFRRACCSLFGYKIIMDDHQRPDGIAVTRFTLASIYGQTDDEKLEFEYESGNMSILANEYCSQPEISRQVEIFVKKMNSIPAFTANLTVESFNRRTLC